MRTGSAEDPDAQAPVVRRKGRARASWGDVDITGSPPKSAPLNPGTELLWLIGHAYRLSRRRMEQTVRVRGVTLAQVNLMMTLAEEPRLSGIDIAERARITPQASHAALVALARKGLVTRVAESTQRRVVRTTLTDDGARVLTQCLDDLRDVGIEFGERLGQTELQSLLTLMREYLRANDPTPPT